jgi:hypothetical protein
MRYTELKQQLKDWAIQIRVYKNHRKLDKRGDYTLSFLEYEILKLKHQFRHNHIAYCELRGREYNEIENPSKDNQPNRKLIDSIKLQWGDVYAERNGKQSVCSSENRLTQ